MGIDKNLNPITDMNLHERQKERYSADIPKAFKTLIICGTVKVSPNDEGKFLYDLCLLGQTPENPTVQVITYKLIECANFSTMQAIARQAYADYFKIDLYNIITIENIILI